MATIHPTIEAIEAINLEEVTPFLLARHASRKVQATAARALFQQLGLKKISVTVPRYSMASTVDVRLPEVKFTAEDYAEWDAAYNRGEDTNTTTEVGRIRTRENAAAKKLEAILNRAFPNHIDKSDYSSDYFDRRWSVR